MKNQTVILTTVLVLASGRTWAQDYGLAAENVFFMRSPSITQQSIDSDYRLRAMGHLNLPVADESNTLGVFKYGGAAAGLPLDYPQSKLELSLYGEGGTLKDEGTEDDAFTGDLFDSSEGAFGAMTSLRIGSNGAFAASLNNDVYEAEFPDGTTNEPGGNAFFAGYGQRLGNLLLGISADGGTVTSVDISGVQKLETEVRTFAPSVGYVFTPAQDHNLILAFTPEFREIETTNDVTFLTSTEKLDLDGTRFSEAIHYMVGQRFAAALVLSQSKDEGDYVLNNGASEDTELKGGSMNLRTYYRAQSVPLSFGFSIESTQIDTVISGANRDSEVSSSRVGFGMAYHFRDERGLIGFELAGISEEDTDNLDTTDPDSNEERNGSEFSLGAEYRLVEKLWGRAGIHTELLGEDPVGSAPELETQSAQLTLGLEFLFSPQGSVAFTLASTGISSDGLSGGTPVDKQEFGAGSFEVATKFKFGQSNSQ